MSDEADPERTKYVQMTQRAMDGIIDRLNEVASEFAGDSVQDHTVASILINSMIYSTCALTKEILERIGAKLGHEEYEEFRAKFLREMIGTFDRLIREKAAQHGKEIRTGFGAYGEISDEPR